MMIALLSTAFAQESTFTPSGAECGDAAAIAGTAGIRNASEAIQLNANTYSAVAFTKKHLIGMPEGTHVVMDLNTTYGATHLPVFHEKSIDEPDECLPEYRVAMRPLDLTAANFGLSWSGARGTLIAATSATWAGPAAGDQLNRVLMTSFVAPAYQLVLSGTAPLVDLMAPGPMDFSTQSTAVTLDWLIGATASLDRLELAAAYLGSRGGYALVSERTFGAYAFAARSMGTGVFKVGLDRTLFGPGMTSLDYLDIPDYQAAPETESRLRVGSLREDDLGGTLDLAVRYRLAPDREVSEVLAAVHSSGFHTPREEDAAGGTVFLLQGGYVTTPTAWSMGLGPAKLPSARGVLAIRGEEAQLDLSVYYNDPDQLQLYPFARGALSYQLLIKGAL